MRNIHVIKGGKRYQYGVCSKKIGWYGSFIADMHTHGIGGSQNQWGNETRYNFQQFTNNNNNNDGFGWGGQQQNNSFTNWGNYNNTNRFNQNNNYNNNNMNNNNNFGNNNNNNNNNNNWGGNYWIFEFCCNVSTFILLL